MAVCVKFRGLGIYIGEPCSEFLQNLLYIKPSFALQLEIKQHARLNPRLAFFGKQWRTTLDSKQVDMIKCKRKQFRSVWLFIERRSLNRYKYRSVDQTHVKRHNTGTCKILQLVVIYCGDGQSQLIEMNLSDLYIQAKH